MRIVYFDIDSLRPDRLGCYGYHRPVSPHIDAIAAEGARWNNCYATDVPCLPSRTALFSGRPGIQTGAVNHGGPHAAPYPEPDRGFRAAWDDDSWMMSLRNAGYRCATVSSFAERHSAWYWTAGFNDILNSGKRGHETVQEVVPLATQWLDQHGREENWFLHINLWDVHVPYRSPQVDIAGEALPQWAADMFPEHANNPGLRAPKTTLSSRNMQGTLESVDDFKDLMHACDEAIVSVDQAVGILHRHLETLGNTDDVVVIISADHGENFGEWSSYAAHCTADSATAHIPLIIKGGGFTGNQAINGLCQHIDLAATVCAITGATKPDCWEARPLPQEHDSGRDYVVTSQLAQCAQRSVHWQHNGELWGYLTTALDLNHGIPEECVYRPEDQPPAPIEDSARLHEGRTLLDL